MDEDDPGAASMPPEQWFAAADGLAAVWAAIAHLRDKPRVISWSADALDEFGLVEAALTAAAKKKRSLHFLICD